MPSEKVAFFSFSSFAGVGNTNLRALSWRTRGNLRRYGYRSSLTAADKPGYGLGSEPLNHDAGLTVSREEQRWAGETTASHPK